MQGRGIDDGAGEGGIPQLCAQDTEAARRICESLRAAGWFDKSELRGGDAWVRQIRRQIHDCALFIAIISAHSDAR